MGLEVTQLPIIGLGIIALVALLSGVLFTRLGMPSSLGYILAGILLVPLGILPAGESIAQLFGEIGVLMLLFYLGLELSIEKFKQNGVLALLLVFVEFAAAFATGFAVSKLFGFSDIEAIVVGGMLPFASTVIVVKFLMEKKILDWPEARVAISSLIIEDFFAIMVLVLLTSITSARSVNVLVLNALLFVVAAFFVVRKLSKQVLLLLSRFDQEDKMALYAVGVGIVVGYLGQVLGLSTALGAYFAGFALAETKYAERIKRELGLFREFFVLFFFVSFGSTVVFPTSPDVYIMLGLLLLAYLASKIIAYGVFGSAIGLNVRSAISTGVLMLPIGEFSILIAAAAAPLASHASQITSMAFLLTIATGVAAPLLFDRRETMTQHFLKLYPVRARKALSIIGREMHLVEHISKSLQTEFWNSVKNLLVNFVIALSVVYVAAVLNTQVILPAFPDLPSSATLALLVLPFVVWPVYRSLQELRFLTQRLSSHLLHPHLAEKTSEGLAGLLSLLASILAAAWLYAQKTPPLFLLLPLLYSILALVLLSKSIQSFFEHFEGVHSMALNARVHEKKVLRLAKAFDERSSLLGQLTELRAKARDQINEALNSGETSRARRLLANFRKQEAVLLEALNRSTPAHPFKQRRKSKHLEGYFLGRLKTKKH